MVSVVGTGAFYREYEYTSGPDTDTGVSVSLLLSFWCVQLNHFPSLSRFVPDREFSGADHGPRRDGPVQFEEDPFGLDKFLEEAKQHGGSKRASTSGRSKDYDHEKKRRKE